MQRSISAVLESYKEKRSVCLPENAFQSKLNYFLWDKGFLWKFSRFCVYRTDSAFSVYFAESFLFIFLPLYLHLLMTKSVNSCLRLWDGGSSGVCPAWSTTTSASLCCLCCPYSTDLETFLRPAFVHSHLQWLFQLNWEPEQVRLKQGSYSPLNALETGTTDKKMEQTVGTGIFLKKNLP